MLTGDNKENAHEMNKLLHIDEIIAEVLPDQKAEIIRSYQKRRHDFNGGGWHQ